VARVEILAIEAESVVRRLVADGQREKTDALIAIRSWLYH
jgi:DNA topoisomerase VI subunit A